MSYHCKVRVGELPGFPEEECWVKADMIATVAFNRLDLFRGARSRVTGKREYISRSLSEHDLEKVRACVRSALGL